MNAVFQYGEKELNYLQKCDGRMAGLIERFGMIQREVVPDLFTALVGNIIGQQVSGKAAATIFTRVQNVVKEMQPQLVLAVDNETLRSCGLSQRKVNYIRAAAEAALDQRLSIERLSQLSDDELIPVLTELPGVGVWTAEMLMIFSLQRPDVLSRHDLIIRRSLCSLYHLPELTREMFEKYRKLFSPYGTVASFYLWAYGNALTKEEIDRIGK